MADGLCMGEMLSNVNEKTVLNPADHLIESVKIDYVNVGGFDSVDSFYNKSASSELCENLYTKGPCSQHEDMMDINMTSSGDEDCRKKRCVDRYDSSESSDSGVAILSCTDCSGSSTASSDITDPGSPFSTASSHSEDSGLQPSKMPPTHNGHWLWTEEQPTLKRSSSSKNISNKRLKSESTPQKCLNNNITSKSAQTEPSLKVKRKKVEPPKQLQQGKITEYFKSQYKPSNLIKKELTNIIIKSNVNKPLNLVDSNKKVKGSQNKATDKVQKVRTVPRKILPAPSKQPDKFNVNTITPVNSLNNFSPILTTLIPNVAYIHAKAPKPPDNIFLPQFTINDKISSIPIVNRPPCINVLQPLQKITTINNFNCVKLNTAVVPIVKLNMPSKSYLPNGSNFNVINTAVPTVLATKVKMDTSNISTTLPSSTSVSTDTKECLTEELSPSDSGAYSNGSLEISIDDESKIEEQKSPILSQPKIIRFPAKKRLDRQAKISLNVDTASCQWNQCDAQFQTNGALLEHLQVNHVISQATLEQYVCLWQGCKVHGRKSCSRSWLERHVLAHAGSKPFRCIVDGCGLRFNSQLALEKHVNSHFNTDNTLSNGAKKTVENGSSKLYRRNGKKIRFRRQPWSARMFDFIDSGIMEGLQYKLLSITEKRTLGDFESSSGDAITLQSQILAQRVEEDGSRKLLLHWHPEDIVEDEWICEKQYKPTKVVSIPKLQPSAKESLTPALFSTTQEQRPRQKHRRKPMKNT